MAPAFNEATEFKVSLVKSEFQYSQSVLKNQKKIIKNTRMHAYAHAHTCAFETIKQR